MKQLKRQGYLLTAASSTSSVRQIKRQTIYTLLPLFFREWCVAQATRHSSKWPAGMIPKARGKRLHLAHGSEHNSNNSTVTVPQNAHLSRNTAPGSNVCLEDMRGRPLACLHIRPRSDASQPSSIPTLGRKCLVETGELGWNARGRLAHSSSTGPHEWHSNIERALCRLTCASQEAVVSPIPKPFLTDSCATGFPSRSAPIVHALSRMVRLDSFATLRWLEREPQRMPLGWFQLRFKAPFTYITFWTTFFLFLLLNSLILANNWRSARLPSWKKSPFSSRAMQHLGQAPCLLVLLWNRALSHP